MLRARSPGYRTAAAFLAWGAAEFHFTARAPAQASELGDGRGGGAVPPPASPRQRGTAAAVGAGVANGGMAAAESGDDGADANGTALRTVAADVGEPPLVVRCGRGGRRVAHTDRRLQLMQREYAYPMEDARMKAAGHPGTVLAQILIIAFAMPGRIRLFISEEYIGF